MKKAISIVISLVLCLSVFTGCSNKNANESKQILNLYTWEGMFPKEVLADFTTKTGIEVNYSSFDFDETMLAKLEAAKGGDYDLVIADDYIIEMAIEKNLVKKLDKSKISNIKNVNPLYQSQFFDKTDEYTVPYGAGIQTIVYNPDIVKKEIKGYADLWDESLKNTIGVVGNYRVIDGMALKVMNKSYNVEDITTIENAGKKLMELAPNIRLIKDDNLQDDLISGEIGAAVMYTSQVTSAMIANPNLKVVFPSEGIGFGIMGQFIPVNAPNSDAAHKFIDYILQPEVSAKCFEYIGFYCTNLEADKNINEIYKPFLTLPTDIKSNNMEMIQNISADAEAAHVKMWTEFRNNAGK